MKTGWGILFGVVGGLLGAGLLLLATRPPRGKEVLLAPAPTPLPLEVQVEGAVAHPGVLQLPAGARLGEALEAAGGLLPQADTRALNLATLLQDGDKIVVPLLPPTPAPTLTRLPGATSAPEETNPSPPAANGLININTATLEELDALPGIGPAIAQRIIDYRTQNGPFASIEDIQNVAGIGPSTFQKIKDRISVGS